MVFRRLIFFSEGNVEVDGKKVYMPIYMIMFMDNLQLDNPIYRLDLSGLEKLKKTFVDHR